jgi:nucleoside diphosphate kinase
MTKPRELVHVMLKPDTLEFGMRDVVMRELHHPETRIIATKTVVLTHKQINLIYPRFNNERAKPTVFNYFTSNPTEHVAIVGPEGAHELYKQIRGKTGSGKGIRGRYYTRYNKLTEEELVRWFNGSLPDIEAIDLEMFGRDILHASNCAFDSARALLEILDPEQIAEVIATGVPIP